MEIKHPRRALFLGGPDSGVLDLLKELTGTAPIPHNDVTATSSSEIPSHQSYSTAGLIHNLHFSNTYYTADIPLWLDEPSSTISSWEADFLEPDAREVVKVVAAWVVIIRAGTRHSEEADGHRTRPRGGGVEDGIKRTWYRTEALEAMKAVRNVITHAHGGAFEEWDGVCLVVEMPAKSRLAGSATEKTAEEIVRDEGYRRGLDYDDEDGLGPQEDENEEWEDACWDLGFEYIDCSVAGVEETRVDGMVEEHIGGMREKTGMERVHEALEACDWSGGDEVTGGSVGDFDDEDFFEGLSGPDVGGDEGRGFKIERMQMEREFMRLKMAMTPNDEDSLDDDGAAGRETGEEAMQVEEMQRMMRNMLAVKEMTSQMPEAERKRFAARAVKDLMNSI